MPRMRDQLDVRSNVGYIKDPVMLGSKKGASTSQDDGMYDSMKMPRTIRAKSLIKGMFSSRVKGRVCVC